MKTFYIFAVYGAQLIFASCFSLMKCQIKAWINARNQDLVDLKINHSP
jgi:hypothetical protein